jgi:NADH-quinone oxidoreductase subunit C
VNTSYQYSYTNIEELLDILVEKGLITPAAEQQPPTAIGRRQVQSSDLAFVTVVPAEARHLIQDLRDRFGFTHLVLLTAVDYLEEGKFLLTYMLHNYELHHDIGVQVPIGRDGAAMESIHDLWAQAGTYQRELKEMFGIDFPGSPRVDEPFILEGWDEVPPMRREFDTKQYSETTYFPRPGRSTNDPADYMRQKLYPKE